jgi:hypothetical protein
VGEAREIRRQRVLHFGFEAAELEIGGDAEEVVSGTHDRWIRQTCV